MEEPELPPLANAVDPSSPVIVHFYRAVVGHMDVWRQRMDATTNWAAATTAAMVTFAFSAPESPHFMLLLTVGFDTMFLLMESRRYQIFDVWRRRFRLLNRYVIAPSLGVTTSTDPAVTSEALRGIGVELGRMVPHISLTLAVGYRIRRNYGYVFTLLVFAWILKLAVHPTGATTVAQLVDRAAISVLLPGPLVIGIVLTLTVVATALGLAAPTERMVDWADLPSPLRRLVYRSPGRAE